MEQGRKKGTRLEQACAREKEQGGRSARRNCAGRDAEQLEKGARNHGERWS